MAMWRSDPDTLRSFEDPQTFRQVPMDNIERIINFSYQQQCSMIKTIRTKEVQDLLAEGGPAARRFVSLRYDRWIDFHLEFFGKDRLLVIDFADLISQPKQVLTRVGRFLGLAETAVAASEENRQFKQNASHKVFRLNDESRKAIANVFQVHNERLRKISGVDLNHHMNV
jgi:hypothetical protein